MGENKREERDMVQEKRIVLRILGLFLIFYGFLALSQPDEYGLGIPTQYSPLLALLMMILGIYLIIQKRFSYE